MIKAMLSDRYVSENGAFSIEGTFWEKDIRMGLFRTADKTIFIRLYDVLNNFYIENYLKQDKKIGFTPERVLADRLSFYRLPDDHVGLELLELIASEQITIKKVCNSYKNSLLIMVS